MAAKEMFEKLGYEYIDTTFGPYYQDERNISKGEFKEISFIEKDDICYHTVKASYGNGIPKDITMDELKAIIQQVKELHWLDEKAEIKQEIKQETNLDYYKDEILESCLRNLAVVKGKPKLCPTTNCSDCDFKGSLIGCHKRVEYWLKQPHEKLVYKLTKFEKELLQCYPDIYSFKVFNSLNGMKEKGYFKDVDGNEIIGDILADCEVIE